MCPTCPSTGSPHVDHYERVWDHVHIYKNALTNYEPPTYDSLYFMACTLAEDVEFLLTEIEENK